MGKDRVLWEPLGREAVPHRQEAEVCGEGSLEESEERQRRVPSLETRGNSAARVWL